MQWTDEEKLKGARRFLLNGYSSGSDDVARWFRKAIGNLNQNFSDDIYCAYKRACGIHTGGFPDEPYLEKGYFKDDKPDYPKQWLNHMSEEAAEYLYNHIKHCGLSWSRNDFLNEYGPAHSDLVDDFVKVSREAFGNEYKPRSLLFETGVLEVPDCLNESELNGGKNG